MVTRTQSLLVISGITVAGVVAYAVYFDYKRRNDVAFRKKLRKERKRVDKSIAESKAAEPPDTGDVSQEELRQALEQVKAETVPASPEDKETYFMNQVGIGEQLALQDLRLPAAMSFYRALRVYPSPVELMVIYEKTVPEPVFKLILSLTNLDVSAPHLPGQSSVVEEIDDDASPVRTGPPSETSSQEWDKVSDSGSLHPS